jgi:PqqD family protein of HPr-rel-A system
MPMATSEGSQDSEGAKTQSWHRDPILPFQRLDEEAIVVDPRTREVHLLNVTATRIWDLLDTPRTEEEISTALAEEFDAPADVLRADVAASLGELSAKGLIGADVSGTEAE